MGKIWFGKVAEGVIGGGFKGVESTETIGFERLSSLALVGNGIEIHFAVDPGSITRNPISNDKRPRGLKPN